MQVTVSKASVRKLVQRKRLPVNFTMYIAGGWLYDVLKDNNIDHRLWQMTYWVRCKSKDQKRLTISFKEGALP